MSTSIKYHNDKYCEICGEPGAFDFLGDYVCENCLIECPKCGSLNVKTNLKCMKCEYEF